MQEEDFTTVGSFGYLLNKGSHPVPLFGDFVARNAATPEVAHLAVVSCMASLEGASIEGKHAEIQKHSLGVRNCPMAGLA